MVDVIRGIVVNIVDGDTFDMKVTHIGNNNNEEYNNEERVRIVDIDKPELRTPAGQRSKDLLERKLKGREIRCYIQARDTYGRIIAKVRVVN